MAELKVGDIVVANIDDNLAEELVKCATSFSPGHVPYGTLFEQRPLPGRATSPGAAYVIHDQLTVTMVITFLSAPRIVKALKPCGE